MPKVVVVGSGPAGLAAAEALLTEGPADLEVELRTMGHILGGKACSWVDGRGRRVEHGQHVVMGFYDEMRALTRRAGADIDQTSVSVDGAFTLFESRDQRDHELHLPPSPLGVLQHGLSYTGWTLGEKAAFFKVFLDGLARLGGGVPEDLDDVCLSAWCLERGMPLSVMRTTAFRASREAQLNWPGEVSAYAMLSTIRIAGRDYNSAVCRLPAGGMSGLWWDPVGARIEALGGGLVRYQRLVEVQAAEGRLTGLRFGTPLPHLPDRPRYDREPIPVAPGTEHLVTGFDAAILAVPPPSLWATLGAGLRVHPGLRGIGALTTVAPFAIQIWHRERAHRDGQPLIVGGLRPPTPFCIDNQPVYSAYRDDDTRGACLHFVGQEACFEDWPDDLLVLRCMDDLRKIRGFEHLSDEGIVDWEVVRNRADHQRYWNAEPGSLRYKPHLRPGITGLYLAGDWIADGLPFPCMESAVRSGRLAARAVLEDLAPASVSRRLHVAVP